jgi:hypothetical protein
LQNIFIKLDTVVYITPPPNWLAFSFLASPRVLVPGPPEVRMLMKHDSNKKSVHMHGMLLWKMKIMTE